MHGNGSDRHLGIVDELHRRGLGTGPSNEGVESFPGHPTEDSVKMVRRKVSHPREFLKTEAPVKVRADIIHNAIHAGHVLLSHPLASIARVGVSPVMISVARCSNQSLM